MRVTNSLAYLVDASSPDGWARVVVWAEDPSEARWRALDALAEELSDDPGPWHIASPTPIAYEGRGGVVDRGGHGTAARRYLH